VQCGLPALWPGLSHAYARRGPRAGAEGGEVEGQGPWGLLTLFRHSHSSWSTGTGVHLSTRAPAARPSRRPNISRPRYQHFELINKCTPYLKGGTSFFVVPSSLDRTERLLSEAHETRLPSVRWLAAVPLPPTSALRLKAVERQRNEA